MKTKEIKTAEELMKQYLDEVDEPNLEGLVRVAESYASQFKAAEITDEEIEKAAEVLSRTNASISQDSYEARIVYVSTFKAACKWMRDRLKSKS